MDHERLLLSKIIETRDLTALSESGLPREAFLDPTNRRVANRILDYKVEHGCVPTLQSIKADFPNYQFVTVDEPFTDLIQRTRRQHLLAIAEDALSKAVDLHDSADPEGIIKLLGQTLKDMSVETSVLRDTDITETGAERFERYMELQRGQSSLLGIPSGFGSIDKATLGFQPKQLITFVGPPKAGKSTMMLLAAHHAHMLAYKPLLIGFEMTNKEQEERIDSIAAGVSHHRLREGTLTKEEIDRLERSLHIRDAMRPFILSNDTLSTTMLSGVQAKVEKYRPDLLIVDGVYMMMDEFGEKPGSPQALTNITRGFKRMAQNLDIPIIITTQVLEWKLDKKRGITSNSIGYASSFAQDSDLIVGVNNTEDLQVKDVNIVEARNAAKMHIGVRWDWDNAVFEELDPEEMQAYSEEETEGAKF